MFLGKYLQFFFPSVNAMSLIGGALTASSLVGNVKLFSKEAMPTDTSHQQFYTITNISHDQILKNILRS